MMKNTRKYGRFYSYLYKIPYNGDREELKASLVMQYTHDRTDSLHEMTDEEYCSCCYDMEKLCEHKNVYEYSVRQHRSRALHLMQQNGIDTTDWNRVNSFCKNPRIGNKEFYLLDIEELDDLILKLRAIMGKGGLRNKNNHKI